VKAEGCAMAEVGLVRFAQVALVVAKEVVPAYRSKFSKRRFTQPQLLTVLLLMRYEDWTFREAEVRVAEHSDLRAALGLTSAPDHTTLYRFMRRLDASLLQRLLVAVVEHMPVRDAGAILAVDATGLAPGAISTFFVNRKRDSGEGFPWRQWLKWLVAVDGKRQLILSQLAKRGPTNDSATLRPLVAMGQYVGEIDLVLADGEFDSERNHRFIRDEVGAASIIPARRGKADWKKQGVRAEMAAQFPAEEYGQRSLVESVFSAVKRKLSARAPGRSLETQRLQALVLGIAYDIYRL
jgi:DDE family transposase/transposase-like protein DUF772